MNVAKFMFGVVMMFTLLFSWIAAGPRSNYKRRYGYRANRN